MKPQTLWQLQQGWDDQAASAAAAQTIRHAREQAAAAQQLHGLCTRAEARLYALAACAMALALAVLS